MRATMASFCCSFSSARFTQRLVLVTKGHLIFTQGYVEISFSS